jgi:hypothetical protein
MVRLNDWNPRGERLVSNAPMSHWETVTFIAGLRQTGIVAPMLIEGAMNGEAFLAYIEQCLVPTLKRRDVVVVDNVCANLASQRHSSANSRYKRSQVSLVISCSCEVKELARAKVDVIFIVLS